MSQEKKIVTFAEMLDHFKSGTMTTEQLEDVIAEELQFAFMSGVKTGTQLAEAAMGNVQNALDPFKDFGVTPVSYMVH